MTYPVVPAIELLRVDAVQLAHACREIALRGLDDQVVVIGHLAPGVDRPVEALATLCQGFQPAFAIDVVRVDILAAVAARGHMVQPPGEFESKWTGHAARLMAGVRYCKT